MSRLDVVDLGLRPYAEVWELQRELVERRSQDRLADTLLLVEHEPVITLGRGARAADHVLDPAVPVIAIERGGEATYHAPGQLVGYPILKLEGQERDLHLLLRRLEEALIRAIAPWGLAGHRVSGKTGVWVQGLKIASLGLAVRRWVSYHGFALNVDLDLAGFRAIRACGMEATVMTSLAALLDRAIDPRAIREAVIAATGEVLERDVRRVAEGALAG